MKICVNEIWEDLGWCPLDSAFIKLRELRGIFFWRDKSSSSDLKQPPNLPSSSKEHSTECLVTLPDTFAGILTASPLPLNVKIEWKRGGERTPMTFFWRSAPNNYVWECSRFCYIFQLIMSLKSSVS